MNDSPITATWLPLVWPFVQVPLLLPPVPVPLPPVPGPWPPAPAVAEEPPTPALPPIPLPPLPATPGPEPPVPSVPPTPRDPPWATALPPLPAVPTLLEPPPPVAGVVTLPPAPGDPPAGLEPAAPVVEPAVPPGVSLLSELQADVPTRKTPRTQRLAASRLVVVRIFFSSSMAHR